MPRPTELAFLRDRASDLNLRPLPPTPELASRPLPPTPTAVAASTTLDVDTSGAARAQLTADAAAENDTTSPGAAAHAAQRSSASAQSDISESSASPVSPRKKRVGSERQCARRR